MQSQVRPQSEFKSPVRSQFHCCFDLSLRAVSVWSQSGCSLMFDLNLSSNCWLGLNFISISISISVQSRFGLYLGAIPGSSSIYVRISDAVSMRCVSKFGLISISVQSRFGLYLGAIPGSSSIYVRISDAVSMRCVSKFGLISISVSVRSRWCSLVEGMWTTPYVFLKRWWELIHFSSLWV